MVFSKLFSVVKTFFGSSPQQLSALYSRINWNKLEKALRHTIHNKEYFVRALTHRSFVPVSPVDNVESNERLEFLGDAILNFLVAEFLFEQYPEKEEGELTVLRARLVNRKALAFFAKEINLRQFLLSHTSSAGVVKKGYDTILADAFEAIIAALYLDGGLEYARRFIRASLTSAVQKGYLTSDDQNYKSELLEMSQAKGRGIPRYQTLKEEGPDHDRTFTVQVLIGNDALGVGTGKNKKEAEQAAAEEAIRKLQAM